jgi:uncharacterized membrane protein
MLSYCRLQKNKNIKMNLFRIPVSIVIFLLFFGISVLEAFRTHHWMNVVFWIAIAVMFVAADSSRDENQQEHSN